MCVLSVTQLLLKQKLTQKLASYQKQNKTSTNSCLLSVGLNLSFLQIKWHYLVAMEVFFP